MGRRTDELLAELKDEEAKEQKATPAETTPAETAPAETETTPAETPDEPPAEPPKEPGQPETPPEEPEAPAEPPKDNPPKKKEIPTDPLQRATYSFNRQLGKQKEKYEKEIAEREEAFKKMQAEFDELKKQLAPKEPAKTRADFKNDDEYIDYLVQQRTAKELDKFREESAKAKKAAADEAAKKAAADEEIERQQQAWIENVNTAFGNDAKRVQGFLSKATHANRNGFGQILDACPAAADYLFNNPAGPKVMEKLLDDKDAFLRVFGNGHASQLDVYYSLRKIEESLNGQELPQNPAAPAKKTMPAIGRPGRQAGGGSAPDIFSDDDALRSYIRGLR